MPKTPLKASPLQLHEQSVHELNIKASPGDEEFGQGSLEVDRKIIPHENLPNCWVLSLSITLGAIEKQPIPPYIGMIRVFGAYEVHIDYPGDPERLIRVTGASMLYGFAREALAQLTARSTNGMLTLPSVSFFETAPKKMPVKKKVLKKRRKEKS